MSNVLLYPLLKKDNVDLPTDPDSITEKQLEEISDHYIGETIKHLYNHGFRMNMKTFRDMEYVSEFLKAALCRNVGRYHHLQDAMDDIDESEEFEDKEI